MGQNCPIMTFANVVGLLWSESYHTYPIWQLWTNFTLQFSRIALIAILRRYKIKVPQPQNIELPSILLQWKLHTSWIIGCFFSEYRYFYVILGSIFLISDYSFNKDELCFYEKGSKQLLHYYKIVMALIPKLLQAWRTFWYYKILLKRQDKPRVSTTVPIKLRDFSGQNSTIQY